MRVNKVALSTIVAMLVFSNCHAAAQREDYVFYGCESGLEHVSGLFFAEPRVGNIGRVKSETFDSEAIFEIRGFNKTWSAVNESNETTSLFVLYPTSTAAYFDLTLPKNENGTYSSVFTFKHCYEISPVEGILDDYGY